jgi:sugar phosphate isomerase/epimerase
MTNAAAILEEVCGYCERLGIRILLENMLPHLVFGNVPDMLWIMGAIVSLNVGTCLDTGHALLSGNIGHVIYKLSGHLKLIHASDNRGSFDDHLPPGQGSIDWGQLLLAVSQSQFRGGIIMELAGNKDESFEEMMHKARQGRVYLRNIARRLAMSSPVTDDVASSP